jgi:tartrate-resistant acid phosphatase type 5
MVIQLKKGLFRRYPFWLFLLLVTGFLLKDRAIEFWQEEYADYLKLQDTQVIPELQSNNLADLQRVGLLLFGDAGTGEEGQHEVAAGMWTYCAENPCDLALGLGDNIYPSGVESTKDPLWKSNFEAPYKKFVDAADRDFWMTIGNHDRRGSVSAQLQYSLESPIWKMPARDYAIPKLPPWLNIYVLNTTFITSGADIPPFKSAFKENFQQQLERASAHLCAKPGWRILATHHPLVSNGEKKNRRRENRLYRALNSFIEKCDVNLFFSGHEHMQQHVEMDGVNYLIQGAAGRTRQKTKPFQYDTATSRYLDYQLGFGHLMFTKNKVDIRFNGSRGESLYSHTIELTNSAK